MNRSFIAAILISVSLTASLCWGQKYQPLEIVPNGANGMEWISNESLAVSINLLSWGPNWTWFQYNAKPHTSNGVFSFAQNVLVPGTGQQLHFTCSAQQIAPDKLQIIYDIAAEQTIPMTGIAFSIRPLSKDMLGMTAGGENYAMPFQRRQFELETDHLTINRNGAPPIDVSISPPRKVASENGEIRIWIAGDAIPGGQHLQTKLVVQTGSGLKFYPDEFKAAVHDITPDWFLYSVGRYGTPVDLSYLNKDANGHYISAGSHGFVKVKGDNFAFDDGTPARFWGVNVVAYAALAGGIRADDIAERLARLGVNVVRLHHLDSDWTPDIIDRHAADDTTQHLNATNLEHLDKLIFELKRRGIYVILDPWVGRTFLPGDKVPESDKFVRGNYHMHPYIFFDPHIQELHRKYLSQIWNHVNPYTHLAYKDDPAMALTELCNEFLYNQDIRLEPYRDEYYQMYLQWAAKNGVDPVGDRIFTLNFPIDNQRFYIRVMQQFFSSFYNYDRNDLGIKIPIGDSNWFHWPWEIACQSGGDFMDSHFYYGGDRIGAGYGLGGLWVANPPQGAGTPFGTIGAMALLGKPMSSSECGNNPPKTYRSAYYVGLAAVACLQEWDSLTAFAYSQSAQPVGTLAPYDMESDPATIASLAAGALIYRRQDVQPGRQLSVMTLPGSEIYAFHWENGAEKAFQNTAGFNVALETHRVAVVLGDQSKIPADVHPDEIMTPESAFAQMPEGTQLRSDTGELWRDWKLAVGMINTPRTQVAYGKLGESHMAWQTRDCNFAITTPYATVAMSSLTNDPIASSHHLLLTAIARAENRGMSFDIARTRVVENGTTPILVEPVVGVVRFKTSASHVTAWTIGSNGSKQKEIAVAMKNGEAFIPLRAQSETIFYDITAQ